MQTDVQTQDVTQLQQRLSLAIAILATTQATRAAYAHVRLSLATTQLEGDKISLDAYASKLLSIESFLAQEA